MRKVRTLGLLGTGVIGGGWAARALHFGIDVIAADVKPEMEDWIRGAVANAEPALARLTFAPLPPKGKLSFTTDALEMAKAADLIQENIPEQLALKQRMLAEVSRHAAPDVIIASSTSGLTPTDLQRDMVAPERFCVAHPFNPVYLLPLVELVPGAKTAPATIEAAAQFFTYIGMHALRVRREVPGHLTDRLQEAMWREILHMVNEDVATTGELDESIIYGPGPALGGDGHEPHLSSGRRRDRYAAHARAIRTGPEVAMDQARGAGVDRDADRSHGRGYAAAGGGAFDPRARAAARRLSRGHPASAAAVRHRRGLDAAQRWRSGCTATPGASRCRRRRAGRQGAVRKSDTRSWCGPSGSTTTATCPISYTVTCSARPWMRSTAASASTRRSASAAGCSTPPRATSSTAGEAKAGEPLYANTRCCPSMKSACTCFTGFTASATTP